MFISPFVLVFSLSVILLVHGWVPAATPEPAVRTVTGLSLPVGLERLAGRDLVNALRPVLDALGVKGEVDFIRAIPREHSLVIPVHLPGRDTSVNINLETRSANIATRRDGWRGALVYLHKMPGQHNANIRVNSLFMRLWKWSADATVYLILFLTVSGIYLWIALRAERRIGLALIAAGAFSFAGIVYVVCRYSTPHRDPAQLVLEHFRALEPQAALLHRAVPALFCLALFAHRLAPEPLHVAIPAVLAEPEGLGGGAPHPGSGSRQRSPTGARADAPVRNPRRDSPARGPPHPRPSGSARQPPRLQLRHPCGPVSKPGPARDHACECLGCGSRAARVHRRPPDRVRYAAQLDRRLGLGAFDGCRLSRSDRDGRRRLLSVVAPAAQARLGRCGARARRALLRSVCLRLSLALVLSCHRRRNGFSERRKSRSQPIAARPSPPQPHHRAPTLPTHRTARTAARLLGNGLRLSVGVGSAPIVGNSSTAGSQPMLRARHYISGIGDG